MSQEYHLNFKGDGPRVKYCLRTRINLKTKSGYFLLVIDIKHRIKLFLFSDNPS